jgi:hypothetical protein
MLGSASQPLTRADQCCLTPRQKAAGEESGDFRRRQIPASRHRPAPHRRLFVHTTQAAPRWLLHGRQNPPTSAHNPCKGHPRGYPGHGTSCPPAVWSRAGVSHRPDPLDRGQHPPRQSKCRLQPESNGRRSCPLAALPVSDLLKTLPTASSRYTPDQTFWGTDQPTFPADIYRCITAFRRPGAAEACFPHCRRWRSRHLAR